MVLLVLTVAAIALARRNFRTGRADRRGASRVALFMVVCGCAFWLATNHHVATAIGEFTSSCTRSRSSHGGRFLGAVYLALEPYVRRFWPDSLLGWSRLMAGHIRDPRVGRDVLAGAVFGVALGLSRWEKRASSRSSAIPRSIRPMESSSMCSPGRAGWSRRGLQRPSARWRAHWWRCCVCRASTAAQARVALRRRGSAADVAGVREPDGGAGTWLVWLFPLASGALLTLVVVRFGLLAYAVTWFFSSILTRVPLRLDLSHWAAAPSAWTLALLMALTLFGFYASRAGQPLFGKVLDE